MTKKDYKKIAQVLNDEQPQVVDSRDNAQMQAFYAWEMVVKAMARMLQSDNPAFSEQKFLVACGLRQ